MLRVLFLSLLFLLFNNYALADDCLSDQEFKRYNFLRTQPIYLMNRDKLKTKEYTPEVATRLRAELEALQNKLKSGRGLTTEEQSRHDFLRTQPIYIFRDKLSTTEYTPEEANRLRAELVALQDKLKSGRGLTTKEQRRHDFLRTQPIYLINRDKLKTKEYTPEVANKLRAELEALEKRGIRCGQINNNRETTEADSSV